MSFVTGTMGMMIGFLFGLCVGLRMARSQKLEAATRDGEKRCAREHVQVRNAGLFHNGVKIESHPFTETDSKTFQDCTDRLSDHRARSLGSAGGI